MNKKLIRLTESDLHRIVKESVNKILKETYNGGLDPRTLASLADKRAAQGQNDKATQARQAAADAWNKRFQGYNRGNGEIGDTMYDDSYTIHNHYNDSHSSFNPENNDYTEVNNVRDNNGKLLGTNSVTKNLGAHYQSGDYGRHVAQQMARGNGKYVNGKGWQ